MRIEDIKFHLKDYKRCAIINLTYNDDKRKFINCCGCDYCINRVRRYAR